MIIFGYKMNFFILVRSIFLMYIVSGCIHLVYATPTPQVTILTGALGNNGDKFPDELIKLWETISITQNGSNVEITPNIKLLRIDLVEEKEFNLSLANSWIDNLIKPDPRVYLKKTHDNLEQSKINNDFSNNQPPNEAQIKDRKEKYSAEIPMVFEIIQTKSDLAKNQFASVNELLPVLKKQIDKDIVDGVNPLKYLILYNLPNSNTIVSTGPVIASSSSINKTDTSKPSSKCNSQTEINQGIQFISMSKAKTTKALQKSDLTNAFNIFNNVVQETNSAGVCCTKALMNRGIVRDLLGESNLAFIDLKAAEQCDTKNMEVHYNLACHYSKHSTKSNQQLDLALQELEKAVESGLKNCNQILNDSDLMNLRRDKDFKVKLRDMLQQHGQFCIIALH